MQKYIICDINIVLFIDLFDIFSLFPQNVVYNCVYNYICDMVNCCLMMLTSKQV